MKGSNGQINRRMDKKSRQMDYVHMDNKFDIRINRQIDKQTDRQMEVKVHLCNSRRVGI